jgi:PHS family inorganic phosphate transporter-like MFS transporter
MYGVELMIIIVATVASAVTGESRAVTVAGTIMFWRVIMGVGIGGDYPLSAIITSEFATKKRRGAMMASVFAMQGFGILASAIVALIVLAAFRSAIIEDVSAVDYCWRIVLGVGAVPGLLALYFRLTIPETPRYTMDVEYDVNKATNDITNYLQTDDSRDENDGPGNHVDVPKASWSDFVSYFGKWKNGKVLLGTSMSWFALDIAFYGIGLNNGIILSAIGYADTHEAEMGLRAYNSLKNMAVGNIIITMLGTVPGYWVTVAFVDSWGRKPIQLMGFGVLTALFIAMGAAFNPLKEHSIPAFIVLFTLLQVFKPLFSLFFFSTS